MKGRISSFETLDSGEIRLGILLEGDSKTLKGRTFGEPVDLIFEGDSSPAGFLQVAKTRRKAIGGEALRIDLHNAIEAYERGTDPVTFGVFLEMLYQARDHYDRGLKP